MGLEHYQFEPTKKNYEKLQKGISQTQKENIFPINHWENLWFGKIEWCTCKNCRAETWEIDCLSCREVDAITDEQFSGNIWDRLHILIKYL